MEFSYNAAGRNSGSGDFNNEPIKLISIPSFGAELSIEYKVIVRSGVTPVPGGNGTSVPSGYTVDQSECQDVLLRAVGGCEIFNTAAGPLDDMLFKGGFEG